VRRHDAGDARFSLQVWGMLVFHLWHDWMAGWTGATDPVQQEANRSQALASAVANAG
jgi:hypothetical protein